MAIWPIHVLYCARWVAEKEQESLGRGCGDRLFCFEHWQRACRHVHPLPPAIHCKHRQPTAARRVLSSAEWLTQVQTESASVHSMSGRVGEEVAATAVLSLSWPKYPCIHTYTPVSQEPRNMPRPKTNVPQVPTYLGRYACVFQLGSRPENRAQQCCATQPQRHAFRLFCVFSTRTAPQHPFGVPTYVRQAPPKSSIPTSAKGYLITLAWTSRFLATGRTSKCQKPTGFLLDTPSAMTGP
ncbi:hypothetical protein LZ31DRAFT_246455 [Colletotrichum somersetense]|nr:hypothetical protein LZ31DRAFT_246455 [Colletotrichum somersetense]